MTFTGCSTDDGAGLGDGGALWLGQVTLPQTVAISNTTFTNNTAAENGGAIYWTAADSLGHTVQMTNLTFTGNVANGDSSMTAEYGGGAIWSKNSSSSGPPLWLISNSVFTNNSAPNGVGGAIAISSNGTLAYPAASTPQLGGVVASHFAGNVAGGAASADLRGGSGGAIYFHGDALTGCRVELHQQPERAWLGRGDRQFQPESVGADGARECYVLRQQRRSKRRRGREPARQRADHAAQRHARGQYGDRHWCTPGGGALFSVDTNAGNVQVGNTILASSGGAGGNCAYSASAVPLQNLGGNLQFAPNTVVERWSRTIRSSGAPAILGGPNTFVYSMDMDPAGSPASEEATLRFCAAAPVLATDATGRASIRPSGRPTCDIGAYESAELTPVTLQSFEVD